MNELGSTELDNSLDEKSCLIDDVINTLLNLFFIIIYQKSLKKKALERSEVFLEQKLKEAKRLKENLEKENKRINDLAEELKNEVEKMFKVMILKHFITFLLFIEQKED